MFQRLPASDSSFRVTVRWGLQGPVPQLSRITDPHIVINLHPPAVSRKVVVLEMNGAISGPFVRSFFQVLQFLTVLTVCLFGLLFPVDTLTSGQSARSNICDYFPSSQQSVTRH